MPRYNEGSNSSLGSGLSSGLPESVRGTSRWPQAPRNQNGSQKLTRWLETLPKDDGIHLASEPTHFGGNESGEDDYAAQFARDELLEAEIGSGLRRALSAADMNGPALEFGAGTGILTRPLLAATDYPRYLVTDTSTDFLRRTRKSLKEVEAERAIDYVVMGGEQMGLVPADSLSLVALRYVLHHILEWEQFVHASARALRPGGVLAFEEPVADGLVLQAALADAVGKSPDLAGRRAAKVRRDLDVFARTTLFYATTGVDKSAAEDKHVFPAQRLLEVCQDAGLQASLYPNQGFEAVLDPARPGPDYFKVEFRHNLGVNFGFGEDTLRAFDRYLAPVCKDLAVMDPRRGAPVVKASVIAHKPDPDISRTPAWEGTFQKIKALASDQLKSLSQRRGSSGPRVRGPMHALAATESRPSEVLDGTVAEAGYSLTFDYPPSASPGPRWGEGRPAHPILLERIAAHAHTYHSELKRASNFAGDLRAIEVTASDPREPSWINGFLPGLDGVALYAFVRDRKPRRYLEIGSGNSTKFVARAKRDASLDTTIISIDPYPRAEVDELCDTIIRQPLESVASNVFDQLASGDVVFFDGSHRTFTSSDATVFFLEVLPNLPTDTLVGVHDVFLPDDYPSEWTDRHYSEQYLLASYLLAGCDWLTPTFAAWYVSSQPELRHPLDELWRTPHMLGVERHGCAFWMHVKHGTAVA